MRHGVPQMPDRSPITASQFPDWCEKYNAAGLAGFDAPENSVQIAQQCSIVVSSNLLRSRQSAQCLVTQQPALSDGLFRELSMPDKGFPSPRLPPSLWAAVFRILWMAGLMPAQESFAKTRQRASGAAEKLVELAQSSGGVLLVGHGFFNHFIATSLRQMGWGGPRFPAQGHWAFSVYHLHQLR